MASTATVMLSGLPGNMCVEVGKAALRRGLNLAECAFTGPKEVTPRWMQDEVTVAEGGKSITMKVASEDDPDKQREALTMAKNKHGDSLVVVDFSHPDALLRHAEMFADAGVAFVIGTNGGDRAALAQIAENSAGAYAFIAPNMCKQIVAFQCAMERMAVDFPGVFEDYTAQVAESAPKRVTSRSSVADDMVSAFQKLGAKCEVADIQTIRDDEAAQKFGVPKDHIDFHGYHSYDLKSSDGSVSFKLNHEVDGGLTYAEGAIDAVLYLSERKAAADAKKVFNMRDLLFGKA